MRYHPTGRDFALRLVSKRQKNLKWLKRKIDRGQLRATRIPSGFSEDQTWGALEKAWLAFTINNSGDFEDPDKRQYYAAVIQKLEHELGVSIHSFDDLKMSALTFYSQHAHELPDDITGDEIFQMMLNSDDKLWKKIKNEGSLTLK
jgi:hypothetical protein